MPAWAVPGFREALGPAEIPWGEVGKSWLLVRYLESRSGGWIPPGSEGLFLIGPDNAVYAVSDWNGVEILDWSPEGGRILVFDGSLKVVDLRDGTESVIPVYVPAGNGYQGQGHGFWLHARFTRPTGRDVVVRVVDDLEHHVSLQCLRTDGTLFARLADFDLPTADGSGLEYVSSGITWLYGPAGTEMVVATSDGISLLTNLGAPVRRLDTPGLGCTLARWWDEGSVLGACYDPDWAASPCWYSGPGPGGRSLWAVPLDGSAATRLTPIPVCTPGAWEPDYVDGLQFGNAVAARAAHCCECGGNIDLIDGDTVTRWMGYADSSPSGPSGESHACSPYLIATRGDRLLVGDTVYGWDPDHGARGGFGAVFEVAGDGTTLQAITPVEAGEFGGVLQVLTTDETGQ